MEPDGPRMAASGVTMLEKPGFTAIGRGIPDGEGVDAFDAGVRVHPGKVLNAIWGSRV